MRNRDLFVRTVPVLLAGTWVGAAQGTEPCGGLDECKVLVEINASDGDLGFHWLVDSDGLAGVTIHDPMRRLVFRNEALGPLLEQNLTETFGESAEPLCYFPDDPDEDFDPDDVDTIEDFLNRWHAGMYTVFGRGVDGVWRIGQTPLTFFLPAAPEDLEYDDGEVSWSPGSTLGECASEEDLDALVASGMLPIHPRDVPVAQWEVVVEADNGSVFSVRVPATQTSIEVPEEFLESIPANTLGKIEVGAIGGDLENGDDDNATFTEEGDLCFNASDDDDDDDDDADGKDDEEGCEEDDD